MPDVILAGAADAAESCCLRERPAFVLADFARGARVPARALAIRLAPRAALAPGLLSSAGLGPREGDRACCGDERWRRREGSGCASGLSVGAAGASVSAASRGSDRVSLGRHVQHGGAGGLVFERTGSGVGVGAVVAAEVAPVLLLAPAAGLLVDRLPRVRVMIAADLWRLVAAALPLVADSITAVYVVAFALAAGTVFFNPAAQSVVPSIVEEDQLVAANSGLWLAAVVSQIVLAPLGEARFLVRWIVIPSIVLLSSWVVLVLLAARLPPGVLKDLAGFLPACITLIRRLRADPRVPRRAKVAVVLAGLWVLSPIDLIPEFLPVIGPLDDAVVVALALRFAARRVPRSVLLEAWPAEPRLLDRLLGSGGRDAMRG